jgi:hypothetical protein
LKISQAISPLEIVEENGDESEEDEDTNGQIEDENEEHGQYELKEGLKINKEMVYLETQSPSAFKDNVEMKTGNGKPADLFISGQQPLAV